ncbi:MAG: superoxide dismutase [Anaerolinea sp.]|nr:superoxide dismutase [Anaerolinea sp.]
MKILALEKEVPNLRSVDFAPYLRAEARRVWELMQMGILREAHFRQDQRLAVLVLECDQLGQAQTALESLPLVQAGLITFELIALRPYDGLARLFGDAEAGDLPTNR